LQYTKARERSKTVLPDLAIVQELEDTSGCAVVLH
jgi:hypothetical protein